MRRRGSTNFLHQPQLCEFPSDLDFSLLICLFIYFREDFRLNAVKFYRVFVNQALEISETPRKNQIWIEVLNASGAVEINNKGKTTTLRGWNMGLWEKVMPLMVRQSMQPGTGLIVWDVTRLFDFGVCR